MNSDCVYALPSDSYIKLVKDSGFPNDYDLSFYKSQLPNQAVTVCITCYNKGNKVGTDPPASPPSQKITITETSSEDAAGTDGSTGTDDVVDCSSYFTEKAGYNKRTDIPFNI